MEGFLNTQNRQHTFSITCLVLDFFPKHRRGNGLSLSFDRQNKEGIEWGLIYADRCMTPSSKIQEVFKFRELFFFFHVVYFLHDLTDPSSKPCQSVWHFIN